MPAAKPAAAVPQPKLRRPARDDHDVDADSEPGNDRRPEEAAQQRRAPQPAAGRQEPPRQEPSDDSSSASEDATVGTDEQLPTTPRGTRRGPVRADGPLFSLAVLQDPYLWQAEAERGALPADLRSAFLERYRRGVEASRGETYWAKLTEDLVRFCTTWYADPTDPAAAVVIVDVLERIRTYATHGAQAAEQLQADLEAQAVAPRYRDAYKRLAKKEEAQRRPARGESRPRQVPFASRPRTTPTPRDAPQAPGQREGRVPFELWRNLDAATQEKIRQARKKK